MTDRYIIERHLNNNYRFSFNNKLTTAIKYIEIRNSLKIKNKEDDKLISQEGLVREVTSLFGNYVTDEGLLVEQIVREWFEGSINVVFSDIFNTLKEVKVVFGKRSWEVQKDGVDYKQSELINKYRHKYSEDVIKAVFDEWRHQEIMRISDEILNI